MAIRVVSAGTTLVKRITVGTPTRIGDPSVGSIVTLDDVNDTTNLADGSYLRWDSSQQLFLHKDFDSDARKSLSASNPIGYNSSTGVITHSSSGVVAGTYGSAGEVPVLSVNSFGHIDSISTTAVAGVSTFQYDDDTGILQIETADGGTFNTTLNLNAFSTTDLSEGSNLYFTNERVDDRIASTITGGSNINVTYNDSLDQLIIAATVGGSGYDLSANSTDDLSEGATNLYYTDARARAAFSLDLDSDLFSYNNSTGVLTIYDSAIARTDREETFTKGIRIPDLEKITFCEGIADIFENGGDFFIRRTNVDLAGESGGNIYIMSRDSGTIHLQSYDGARDLAHFRDHGGTELYWDNNLRFEILSDKIRLRDDVQVDNNLTVLGNLRVDGTTTTLNSTTLSVNDKNIVLADSAVDSAATDGAGITVFQSGAAITYDHANATWDLNRPLGRDINVLSEHSTTDLSEGTNLYYTDARARAAISVADSGTGDGSLSYDNTTGVITYTGPSASEVRSHFSASGDLSYDSATGVFSFDVEAVYTQANFDSDFNTSLDAAALGGVGLAYNSSTNTLSIDSAELSAYFISSTDNVPEGSTNLYFTESRVDSAIRDLTASKAFALIDSFSSSILTVNYDTINNKPAASFNAIPDSGQIIFFSDTFAVADPVGNVFIRTFSDSGQVVLYHNDNKKLRTTSTGVTITGTAVGDFDRSANTTVTAGTYGSASQVPILTVDNSGFIDSIGSVSVAGVSTFTFDSATATLNIGTADGGSFNARIGLQYFSTTDLSEGTNLYYTTTRFDSDFGDNTTSDLTEGSNLYFTEARARNSLQVLDQGGDGSLTYDSATGNFAYTGPSAAEVRAHFSVADGVVLSSGEISLGNITPDTVTANSITNTTGETNTTPTQTQASSDTIIVVDNTAHDSDFTSIEYTVHMDDSDAGHSQISKVLLTYNKSNVFFTEYGAINSFANDSDIGTLTADVLGDNIRLKFQRAAGMGTVNVKPTKTIIK